MKRWIKKALCIGLCLTLCAGLLGCGAKEEAAVDYADWEAVLEAARGTNVTFYGWGGNELVNNWIDDTLAPYCKATYDITVERVPMDIDMILNKLAGDKAAENDQGSIDLIWINGENFATAKENGLLFGPFCQYLPNYTAYVDGEGEEATVDFGTAIEGYEAPYAKAQLVLIYDTATVAEPPASAEELLTFCQENPGKFTYEAPPGFTGSAFVRNIIYEICGYEAVAALPADSTKEAVREVIAPAMDYLRSLNPYLWEQGKTFPATDAQADAMFMDGQLLLSMSYDPYHVSSLIASGQYPETCRAFIFENGTIGNTNYVAVAYNSTTVPGALCLADAILSIPMQASKMDPTVWGALPVLDMDRLTEEQKAEFDKIETGAGSVDQETLLSRRLPELPAYLVPVIEEIWLEEVPGK